jgi:hypothetical protein
MTIPPNTAVKEIKLKCFSISINLPLLNDVEERILLDGYWFYPYVTTRFANNTQQSIYFTNY